MRYYLLCSVPMKKFIALAGILFSFSDLTYATTGLSGVERFNALIESEAARGVPEVDRSRIVYPANSGSEITASDSAVLIVHGLDQTPSDMFELQSFFSEQLGYTVVSVLMPGFGTQPSDLLGLRKSDWERAIRLGVGAVKELGTHRVAVGFSMGGLYLSDLLRDQSVSAVFEKAILFAPAVYQRVNIAGLLIPSNIACKFKGGSVKYLPSIPDERLKSSTLDHYSATPLETLCELSRTSEELDQWAKEGNSYLPSLRFLLVTNEIDQLVDTKKVEKYFTLTTRNSTLLTQEIEYTRHARTLHSLLIHSQKGSIRNPHYFRVLQTVDGYLENEQSADTGPGDGMLRYQWLR